MGVIMFKSKIALVILFCSFFQLNSINLRHAAFAFSKGILYGGIVNVAGYTGYYAYENSDSFLPESIREKKLEFSVNRLKKQINQIDANNISPQELIKLKNYLATVIIKKYQDKSCLTEKEKKLINDLQESEEMSLFGKYYCKAANLKSEEKVPADTYFQDIFADAKKIMKITDNAPIYITAKPGARGYINSTGDVYINPNPNYTLFGAYRIAILHELAHKKRNHAVIREILHSELNSSQLDKMGKEHETEADTTALEIGNCYRCSRGEAYSVSNSNFYSDSGYLIRDQILEIVKKQEEQNCLCEYHKKY